MQPARLTLMAQILTTPWWLQLLRGLLALAFGFYALTRPTLALVIMVQFLGAFLFVEGVVLLGMAWRNQTGQTKRGFVLTRGLLYVVAGIAVLSMPALATLVTVATLGWFVGFMALLGGVLEISAGLRAEKDQPNDWSMITLGILSAVFGVLLLSAPMAYGVGLSFLFGIWSLIAGLALVTSSFRIRAGKKKLERLTEREA